MHGLTSRLCLPLMLLLLLWTALAAGADARIGVLPVPLVPGTQTEYGGEDLRDSLQAAIAEDLRGAGLGEIIPLQWPELMAPDERPNFETLVGLGRAQGCTGVLLVQLRAARFEAREQRLPLVGAVVSADAEVVLTGGLIDTELAAGIAPIEASSKLNERPYRGPRPGRLGELVLTGNAFRQSLLGKTFDQARRQIVAAMQEAVPQLSAEAVERPQRTAPPPGVGFAQDVFTFETVPGYDRRSIVAVVNRGDRPQRFKLLPLEDLPEVAAGFVGAGSIDATCTLGPGQWKYVRFVVNTNRLLEEQDLPLGLYVADAGEPDVRSTPHDTAIMRLTVRPPRPQLALEVLEQDPFTLAYTCRIVNRGDSDVWHVGVHVDSRTRAQVRLAPNVGSNVYIPGRGEVRFAVVPHLYPGMTDFETSLTLWTSVSVEAPELSLRFAVPEGQDVYWGLSHTASHGGGFEGWCINEGGTYWSDGDRELCHGGDDDVPFLGSTWKWMSDMVGGSPPPPADRRRRQVSVTGTRGATIRPAVLARLPEAATQDVLYPSVSSYGPWLALVGFMPNAHGISSVAFTASRFDDMQSPITVSLMNEKTHAATWPWARFDGEGRALVAWVDSAPGQGANVALRISDPRDYQRWGPVQYLTEHAQGVDDPVLLIGEGGRVWVAWEDLRHGPGRVYLRMSRDGGSSFGPEVALPVAAGEAQSWPQLAARPDGLGLVYVSRSEQASRILYRALDGEGAPLGEPVPLSNPGSSCGEPQIATGPGETLYAVWREGEGAESEIWFTAVAGTQADAPRRLTHDTAYSEYPTLVADEDWLEVAYHSDLSGVTNLRYAITSHDGGQTWSPAATLPDLQASIEQAWLQMNFSLANARDEFPPFSTRFFVNGTEVACLENTVLEGTYLFPLPPGLVNGAMGRLAGNEVEVKVEGIMAGHLIYSSEWRIIARWSYTQLPVVAASQEEADRLAKVAGMDRNHDRPDLVLAANAMPALPASLEAGATTPLVYTVHNVGVVTATEVVVRLFAGDPTDPDTQRRPIGEAKLGSLAPGEQAEAQMSFTFDPAKTPRLYALVSSAEEDFYPADNGWALSFTTGFAGTPPPTLGTDLPHLFYTPSLLDTVAIPDFNRYTHVLSLPHFGDLVSLPGMGALGVPDPSAFAERLLPGLDHLNLPRPGWLDLLR